MKAVILIAAARGEFAENFQRKDFLPSEMVAIMRAVEDYEREAARKRQGTRTDLGRQLPPDSGRSSDAIARRVDVGRDKLAKAAAVVAAAEADPGLSCGLWKRYYPQRRGRQTDMPPRTGERMISRQDWLLLALARRGDNGLSPVQVQKVMFLIGTELPRAVGSNFYRFKPYNYGPFDRAVYDDLGELARDGFVSIDGSGSWRRYAITANGLARAEEAKSRADRNALTYLDRVVDWVCSLAFTDLIRAIYAKYPSFRVNSVFVD